MIPESIIPLVNIMKRNFIGVHELSLLCGKSGLYLTLRGLQIFKLALELDNL